MYALVQKKKETPQDRIRPVGEPTWGRYIPDRPASIYSATTLGNRSGLLSPTSTKQLDYYYHSSAPSLPSLLDYYPLKENYINEKSNDDEDDYYYGYTYSKNNESSVSSSSYYNSTRPNLTIDCDYQVQKTSGSSSSPSLVEPVSAVSGTPLYNSFARRSKNNNLSFRD